MSVSYGPYINLAGNQETSVFTDPANAVEYHLTNENIYSFNHNTYITSTGWNGTRITIHCNFEISRNRYTKKLCCHTTFMSTPSNAYVFIPIFGDIPAFYTQVISGGTNSPANKEEYIKYSTPIFNAIGADFIDILAYNELVQFIAENLFTIDLQNVNDIAYSDGAYTKIDTKLDKIIKQYSTFK